MVGVGMAGSILLLIPPLTQLNTPYPSTAYLTGFLTSQGYSVSQADVGIEMVLALFSRDGLSRAFADITRVPDLPGEARQMLAMTTAYLDSIEPVIRFLQGCDPSLAPLIGTRRFLPEGPRFAALQEADKQAIHTMEFAKHVATLYLKDLADLIRLTIAPHFALSRYAEHLAASARSFDPLAKSLMQPLTLTDEFLLDATRRHFERVNPSIVGITVPFPGNLYGALRIAQWVKRTRPDTCIVLGGGYVNTELRRLQEPRLFNLVDYVTLDDGERPFLCLLEHLDGKRDASQLKRTFSRVEGKVVYRDGAREPDMTMADIGTPTYAGLALDRYLSVVDSLNPMHRLWSEGHWNKLTVAHGCYWKQCTFCDVGLDYIARYETAPTDLLLNRIEALIAETGRRGFHFVDEAAPPAALKALALRLLERGVAISWWGNIRFEEAFTPDLCRLLAASGCIAVSAGLEVASDRLLALMKKGITVDQTVRVAAALRAAGILVHAYLMYGFPTETMAETVESLERVRQLFAHDLIQSAFWHKFVVTVHSPVGLDPDAYGIRVLGPSFGGFAHNDLAHVDPVGSTPDWLGKGLRTALFNYKEGQGLETDVRQWFLHPVPKPRVSRQWISHLLRHRTNERSDEGEGSSLSGGLPVHRERRLVWIGGTPVLEGHGTRRRLILPTRTEDVELSCSAEAAESLVALIHAATPCPEKQGRGYPSLKEMHMGHPTGSSPSRKPIRASVWKKIRSAGLLSV